MPSKRRRISAFVKILLSLTLACGVIVAGAYYVLTTIEPIDSEPEVEPGCRLELSDGKYDMEVAQAVNAATVGGVAFSRNLPEEAVTVAYATVWQESTFYNLEYGDRDSLGLFQQRPSQEWGEPDQILDPVSSSASFYDELTEVQGWQELPVYEAAQAVQRSADGFAYDQHEGLSERMAEVFTGARGPAVTCWFDTEGLAEMREAGSDTEDAHAEMARVFGTDPTALPEVQGHETGDLGWAMAIWAVAHADEYGLHTVTYDGQRWHASDGGPDTAQWTSAPETDGRLLLK
ncbi:hypothetical protein ACFXKD_15505 [Nocardiopsis aegyptia]|uniref:hypothetical protein n=1 Tax=Nocardiopsis aegyptia TaxID=220378 RepID=UPI00366A7625